MPKIIREKYENGVLVERQVEAGSNTTPWHWLILIVHSVIASCLVALVALSVHDSLSLGNATLQEEMASLRTRGSLVRNPNQTWQSLAGCFTA